MLPLRPQKPRAAPGAPGPWLLLLLLGQVSTALRCGWEAAEGGLDPASLQAGARYLSAALEEGGEEGCLEACCKNPECQLALLGPPDQDRPPRCSLLHCSVNGRDVCSLSPASRSTVFRKRTEEPAKKNRSEVPEALEGQERNSTATDACRQPMRVGPCRASFPRFFYDVANKSCRHFIYGGCSSNQNNFKSQEACEAACPGVTGSVLPVNSSSSSTLHRRTQPDPAPNAAPSLDAEDAPEEAQPDTAEPEAVSTTSEVSLPKMSADDFAERCEAEPQVGPCRASHQRWYYSSQTRTCQLFVYGGCWGNKNNYMSEESCVNACTVTVLPSSRKAADIEQQGSLSFQESCAVEANTGPCRAALPMYYYHTGTRTCLVFIYGGCSGNMNRYSTMEECMTRCAGAKGQSEQHSHTGGRGRWTPAFFLLGGLALISVLMLSALILISLRRSRVMTRLTASLSDKEELLPDPEEQGSVESLSVPGSPTPPKP